MKNKLCAKCGSDKIIYDARIVDYSSMNIKRNLSVELIKKKGLINDIEYGELSANICGECGNVELQASNYEELWRVYSNRK